MRRDGMSGDWLEGQGKKLERTGESGRAARGSSGASLAERPRPSLHLYI